MWLGSKNLSTIKSTAKLIRFLRFIRAGYTLISQAGNGVGFSGKARYSADVAISDYRYVFLFDWSDFKSPVFFVLDSECRRTVWIVTISNCECVFNHHTRLGGLGLWCNQLLLGNFAAPSLSFIHIPLVSSENHLMLVYIFSLSNKIGHWSPMTARSFVFSETCFSKIRSKSTTTKNIKYFYSEFRNLSNRVPRPALWCDDSSCDRCPSALLILLAQSWPHNLRTLPVDL